MCKGKLTACISSFICLLGTVATFAEFALIPGGSFQMGDFFNETPASYGERPVHQVSVSTFYMGKCEVTLELWNEVLGWARLNGYTDLPTATGLAPNHPAQGFEWSDAVKWCNARSEKEGRSPCYFISGAVYRHGQGEPVCHWKANGYRLPTEAEWEKAARGGLTGKRFPWGDTITHANANCFITDWHPIFRGTTSPVEYCPPNGYGLYGMAGNVYEWCWDWLSTDYYSASPDLDPRGPASGLRRVARGGSNGKIVYTPVPGPGDPIPEGPVIFPPEPLSTFFDCRVSSRSPYNDDTGFRLAFTAHAPVVFIPGIAGSMLVGGGETGKHGNGEYLWPTAGAQDIRALTVGTGAGDVKAVGVVRSYDPSDWLPEVAAVLETLVVYEPLLNHLTSSLGYKLFILDERPERMTGSYLADQDWSASDKPTLFEFPYDWRLSNASHVSALHDYISRIRQLHGGAKVNVIAHSMGGLLLRRYITTSDYAEDIDKAATIGSPFWGAPKAVYRMLTGEFYDSPVDWDTSRDMKTALRSMPSTAELIPPFQQGHVSGRTKLLSEDHWNINEKDGDRETYSPAQFWEYINGIAPGFEATNAAFHTALQDDWSADDDSISYLHIYGEVTKQGRPTTTTDVVAFQYAWNDDRGRFNQVSGYRENFGPGDNVVPLESARRQGHTAPGTEFLPRSADGSRPGSNPSEHTEMTKDPAVWERIAEFFGVELPSPAVVGRVSARTAQAASTGRKHIFIHGTGYVPIRDDAGHENTRLSEAALKKVPDLDIRYDSENGSLEIDCPVDKKVIIGGQRRTDALDIEQVTYDPTGGITAMTRHRLVADDQKWQLELDLAGASALYLDTNRNGTLESAEVMAPRHQSSDIVDRSPPSATLTLSPAEGAVTATVTAADDHGTPTIRHTLNGGPSAAYASPLVLSNDRQWELVVLAEDAAGNTSGLIKTAVNPVASANAVGGDQEIVISWPRSDAYFVEQSPDLTSGSWSPVAEPIDRDGTTDSVKISIADRAKMFYRLRSHPVTK